MQVPNRYHHSKKEQKRKLKPQALRQAKARLRHFKKRHMTSPQKEVFSYNTLIHTNELHVRQS